MASPRASPCRNIHSESTMLSSISQWVMIPPLLAPKTRGRASFWSGAVVKWQGKRSWGNDLTASSRDVTSFSRTRKQWSLDGVC